MGRLPRVVRGVLVAVAALAACALLALSAFALHFWLTPSFDEYVRSVRASDAVAPVTAAAEVLSSDGDWALGTVDPYAVPESERHLALSELSIRHGTQELLVLAQEFAVAYDGDSNDRAAFSTRSTQLRVHPDFRAVVRILVRTPDQLIGAGSARQGALTIEAWLLAGAGPSDIRVCRDPKLARTREGWRSDSILPSLLGDLLPVGDLPKQGLVYHFEHEVLLSSGRSAGQSWSHGRDEVRFEPNTAEYSYAFAHRLAQGPTLEFASSASVERALRKELNGRAW